MKRSLELIAAMLLLLCPLGGCNMFEYPLYVLFGDNTKDVKAEYDDLGGKKVAVLVMTTPGVDFEYPYAQLNLTELASIVIRQRVKGAEFVDPAEIDRFQREDLDWLRLPIDKIGEKFGVERIVYLDIVQYTMAEENSVNLLRGRIWAEISIYEMEAAAVNSPVYTGEVIVVYPEYAPVPLSSGAQQQIEFRTINMFAEALAKKFYDHKIDWDKASRARKNTMGQ